MKSIIRYCYKTVIFTPRSRVAGLELHVAKQGSEPTHQALSDGILVAGISSKGPLDFLRGASKISQRHGLPAESAPVATCWSPAFPGKKVTRESFYRFYTALTAHLQPTLGLSNDKTLQTVSGESGHRFPYLPCWTAPTAGSRVGLGVKALPTHHLP